MTRIKFIGFCVLVLMSIISFHGFGQELKGLTVGENGENLPVPATYIIGKDGLIKYSFYNTDYKKRVPISTILSHL